MLTTFCARATVAIALLTASAADARADLDRVASGRAGGTRVEAARVSCVASPDSTLRALFDRGQTFPDFLAAAQNRRTGWHQMNDSARVDEALLARARSVGGRWSFLVVAIDRCGDSMNSVPYLAKLAAQVPGLDLRIVLPDAGRVVQESHRSLDGRTATPTIVLLDAEGRDVGCIVELPREIREWAHGVRPTVSSDSLHAGIAAFYKRNVGRGIVTEAVEMLEAAARGGRVCATGSR
jgi:hypothetical protein